MQAKTSIKTFLTLLLHGFLPMQNESGGCKEQFLRGFSTITKPISSVLVTTGCGDKGRQLTYVDASNLILAASLCKRQTTAAVNLPTPSKQAGTRRHHAIFRHCRMLQRHVPPAHLGSRSLLANRSCGLEHYVDQANLTAFLMYRPCARRYKPMQILPKLT